jgi:radical SAM protein with 4Fe4S-binding SPASM domain
MEIIFTGGEPLVRPDFPDLYRLFIEKGFLICLMTNGNALTEEHFRLFREYPPRAVEVSVYGLSPEVFGRTARQESGPERVLENVRQLARENIPVSLKTVALDVNLHEVERIGAFARALGLAFRYDVKVHPGFGMDPSPLTHQISLEQVHELDSRHEELIREMREEVVPGLKAAPNPERRRFRCGMGTGYFVVDPFGYVHPCIVVRSDKWNLLSRDPGEVFREVHAHYSGLTRSFAIPCDDCKSLNACSFCDAMLLLNHDDPSCIADYCEVTRKRLFLSEEAHA